MYESQIRNFVATVRSDPGLSDDSLVTALVRSGTSREDAERCLAFIPMAFEHERLSRHGTGLPTSFLVRNPKSGATRKAALAAQPIYVAARIVAREAGVDDPGVVLVASRSAEAKVVDELGNPADIVLVEPLLLRLPYEGQRSERPWWRRWSRSGE